MTVAALIYHIFIIRKYTVDQNQIEFIQKYLKTQWKKNTTLLQLTVVSCSV